MTDLKPVWPDFIAPPKYDNPDPRWVDPALPDFRLIWKVARECGYAVGLHGSMKRDCDLIAVPWTDEAVLAFDLIDHLCTALNAKVVGPVAGKPHGRLGWNLQVDGYVKVIDISVVPRSQDRAAPDLKRIGTGLYETQSDYRLAPHLQRIVDAAKSAPQWDTQADRLAPMDAAQARPAWLSNCVVCGRIVDTRETDEGGDGHGCEYAEGWTCSSDCAERLHPDPDWMKEGLAAQAREAALLEALQWCSGSDDFQEGGKAREGWLKLCAPLLHGEGKA